MSDAQESLGGGGGATRCLILILIPRRHCNTRCKNGERTSFTATAGTGDYGGYEDDVIGTAQPATSGTGVFGMSKSHLTQLEE